MFRVRGPGVQRSSGKHAWASWLLKNPKEEKMGSTELNNNCACVRLVNEQSETSVQNKYGGAFVGSFDSVFSLWKGSCAVNNFRGKLSCFEFGFCIECEDEVHADDSECPSER